MPVQCLLSNPLTDRRWLPDHVRDDSRGRQPVKIASLQASRRFKLLLCYFAILFIASNAHSTDANALFGLKNQFFSYFGLGRVSKSGGQTRQHFLVFDSRFGDEVAGQVQPRFLTAKTRLAFHPNPLGKFSPELCKGPLAFAMPSSFVYQTIQNGLKE